MGQKGRQIVDTDVKAIVKALQGAYADEWLAHFNYLHAAQTAVGLNANQVASVLKTRSADELAHAVRIGERILELGGTIPGDLSEFSKGASCPEFNLPKDPSDLRGILQAVLKAERCAIGVYKDLWEKTLHKDSVTHDLAEELLADEVKDEEETENLLGM